MRRPSRRRVGSRRWRTWRTPACELGEALLRLMLGAWADDEIGPVLRAVLLTAAHDQTTRERLRRIVEGSLMGPRRSVPTTRTGAFAVG